MAKKTQAQKDAKAAAKAARRAGETAGEKKARKAAKKASRKACGVPSIVGASGMVNGSELLKKGATAAVYGALKERSTAFKLLPRVTKSDINEDLVAGALLLAAAKWGPKSLRTHAVRAAEVATVGVGYRLGAASKSADGLMQSLNAALQVKDKDTKQLLQPNAVSTDPEKLTVVAKLP